MHFVWFTFLLFISIRTLLDLRIHKKMADDSIFWQHIKVYPQIWLFFHFKKSAYIMCQWPNLSTKVNNFSYEVCKCQEQNKIKISLYYREGYSSIDCISVIYLCLSVSFYFNCNIKKWSFLNWTKNKAMFVINFKNLQFVQ